MVFADVDYVGEADIVDVDTKSEEWDTSSPPQSPRDDPTLLAPSPPLLKHKDVYPLQIPLGAKRHSEFYIVDDNITILVEDTVFRVPSYPLIRDSPKLRELLSVDEDLITLDGVLASDFERLLSLIFQSPYTPPFPQTVSEWTSILKLATEWNLSSIRALAIQHLSTLASPVDHITLARSYAIPEWLLPAHRAMCERMEGPTDEEVEKLGVRDLVGIYRCRERVRIREVVVVPEMVDDTIREEVDLGVPTPIVEDFEQAALQEGDPNPNDINPSTSPLPEPELEPEDASSGQAWATRPHPSRSPSPLELEACARAPSSSPPPSEPASASVRPYRNTGSWGRFEPHAATAAPATGSPPRPRPVPQPARPPPSQRGWGWGGGAPLPPWGGSPPPSKHTPAVPSWGLDNPGEPQPTRSRTLSASLRRPSPQANDDPWGEHESEAALEAGGVPSREPPAPSSGKAKAKKMKKK